MSKLKKILSISVVIAIIMSFVCQTAYASGASDFTVENGVLTKYNGSGDDVVIPDNLGITSIGDSAFKGCDTLISVIVPDGVVSIESSAFLACENLECVILPEGLTIIGLQAFYNCKNLRVVTLPDSLVSVGDGAFSYTSISYPILIKENSILSYVPSSYTSYTIPDTVTEIGVHAFTGCGNLTSLTIPKNVAYIGSYEFSNCKSLTFYGYADSYAQGYAAANHILFAIVSTIKSAAPTASSVLVNGSAVRFDAYNIDGSNYFKLRDLAMILNGTGKQFEVGWDAVNNAISLTTLKAYTPVGGELAVTGGSESKRAVLTDSAVYANGVKISITAYNINGSNYFKLRDVGYAVDFVVTWNSATSTIGIDTTNSNGDVLKFKDKNLETEVRKAINKSTGDIYAIDVSEIKTLNIRGKYISDISLLKYFISLESLYASNNQIGDISSLKGLKDLKTLRLADNKINDISPIASLTDLEYLNISGNYVKDISSIKNLKNLTTLCISDNKIEDISILSELSKLESLEIVRNPIADFNPISDLTNLTYICIGGNANFGNKFTCSDYYTVLSSLKNLKTVLIEEYTYSVKNLVTQLPNIESFSANGFDCLDPNGLKLYEAYCDKITTILAEIIKPNMSDLEKEKAIHNYIIKNVSYGSYGNNVSAYGAIINGIAVCSGYAQAMATLLCRSGVECYYVGGTMIYSSSTFVAGQGHAWNIVKIGSKYYHVDATWDDTGTNTTAYFNVSDSYMAKSRTWDNSLYPVCSD